MDWFEFCNDYFNWGIADSDNLKIYVIKSKITANQYKIITGVDYVATID
ncbi:XkdX family protein [Clostridium beijerinckii]|uniref:XkdX family phage protein n=1 Tax=Clostridium beijerinckii TaxID=1520 RepID=A0AAX0B451_CLOBE|nr:XkdX family protein [Clostridium beijerinckii]NRT90167.1 putative XkdX family phage protein [Clostridium beijerinckii]NYC69697.1 putative XkdX family phage protein [Clostridium beijerinckii]UYZ35424.1 XkdX family protein [Clostridium beijerinckii]